MSNATAASILLTTLPNPSAQPYKVLSHLITKGSISPLEASKLYGVERLTSRIHEIRRAAEIRGVTLCVKKEMRRDLPGKRYARYYLHNS